MTAKTSRRNFLKATTLSVATGLTANSASSYAKPKTDKPAPKLKVAMASRVVNPKNGGVPKGHGSETRMFNIHSQLRVQATILEDQNKKIAVFFACDFCMANKKVIDRITNHAKQKHNIDTEAFCFSVSHTHSAPVLSIDDTKNPKCFDADYAEFVIGEAMKVIDDAMKKLTLAKLTYKEYSCTSVAINRRREVDGLFLMDPNPNGPVDHRVQVIEITSAKDNSLMGVMVKYACHPVTVGPTGIGPDYPGFMRDYFEKNHPGATAMFIQGCCGDTRIQIVNQDVTKFTGKSVEAAKRFGRDLALSVEWALAKKGESITGPIKASEKAIKLPLQKYNKQTIEKLRDSRWEDTWAKHIEIWAKNFLAKIEAGEELPTELDYKMQIISLGSDSKKPFIFVGLQGEVVTEYALQIGKKLKGANSMVCGYCNERKTYIPTAKILAEGGYEADAPFIGNHLPARLSPEIEPLIINTAVNLAKQHYM